MAASLPRPVALFGFAGLLPPVALAAACALLPAGGWQQLAWVALMFYSGLIFSFLGGTWWAFAARQPKPVWLLLAVTPSLLAAALLLLLLAPETRPLAGPLLATSILASPLADRALTAAGLTPAWWMRLRVPLSLGLAVCVGVASAVAPAA